MPRTFGLFNPSTDDPENYEDYPHDIYTAIANACSNKDSIFALTKVSKNAHTGTANSHHFRFLNSHCYIAFPNGIRYYILNKNKINERHVNNGNQMVKAAVDYYLTGEFEKAYSLLIDAMRMHGSSSAMQIVAEFSKLPGHIQCDMDNLIDCYSHQETIVFWKNINFKCDTKEQISSTEVNCFINVVKHIWLEDKGISLANIEKVKALYEERLSSIIYANYIYD